MTIMVTDVDEAPEISEGGLAISGMSKRGLRRERHGYAVATYTASGPDADMATCGRLRATTPGSSASAIAGMLMFMTAPDYENAGGHAGMDNDVHGDGEGRRWHLHGHPQDVTVMVTNVDEDGMVELSADAAQGWDWS